jgi:hypothetical protein
LTEQRHAFGESTFRGSMVPTPAFEIAQPAEGRGEEAKVAHASERRNSLFDGWGPVIKVTGGDSGLSDIGKSHPNEPLIAKVASDLQALSGGEPRGVVLAG